MPTDDLAARAERIELYLREQVFDSLVPANIEHAVDLIRELRSTNAELWQAVERQTAQIRDLREENAGWWPDSREARATQFGVPMLRDLRDWIHERALDGEKPTASEIVARISTMIGDDFQAQEKTK